MEIRTCPLCGDEHPLEHDPVCDDWACFSCGLAAPSGVLCSIDDLMALPSRIAELEAEVARLKPRASAELTDRLEAAEADEKRWRELYELRSEALEAANGAHADAEAECTQLKAELARLKQPAHVLAEAERLLAEMGVRGDVPAHALLHNYDLADSKNMEADVYEAEERRRGL
jgi:hypothetical protein